MRPGRWSGGLIITALLVALWMGPGPASLSTPTAVRAPALLSSTPTGPPAALGNRSCSGRACHGNLARDESKTDGHRIWGNEYQVWREHDPHARAFDVLADERSARMERSLRGPEGRAETDATCLACHRQPGASPGGEPLGLQTGGIGCEACHGPAGQWLEPHSRPGWRDGKPSQKRALGMRVLGDVVERARTCAGCHVGAEGREVDHDLIAAGHPRLNFELAAFLADLPKHWSDTPAERSAKSPEEGPTVEARLWLAGQLATAEAALGQLERRAGPKHGPWPELSESDCYACHRPIRPGAGTHAPADGPRLPGAPPWGTWTFALPRLLAERGPRPRPEVAQALDDLAREMSKPAPDPSAARRLAAEAATRVRPWLDEVGTSPLGEAALGKLIAAIAEGDPGPSWDAQAQRYLAVAALHGASRAGRPRGDRDPRAGDAIRDLAGDFAFPNGQDSPGDFDPKATRGRLDEVLRLLRE